MAELFLLLESLRSRSGLQALLLLHASMLLLLAPIPFTAPAILLLALTIILCRWKSLSLLEPLTHSTCFLLLLVILPPLLHLPRQLLLALADVIRSLEPFAR